MQRCFFSPALRWHGACRAEGDKRGENSEDCWILCPYFNVPLMCEWMQIKICRLFFFSWKYCMLQFYKMTVEWNRADDIAYSISFPLFFWPSKLPYVLFKRFWHFHFNPYKLCVVPSFLCITTEPPVVPFGEFRWHIPPGALRVVCGGAASWPGFGVPVKQLQGISA